MTPVSLNCQNMPCPQPVMRVQTLLKTEAPTTLEVVVDNQAALENVSRFLQNKQYTVIHTVEGALWRIVAQANGHSASQNTPDCSPAVQAQISPAAEDKRTLVLIVSPVLGSGDDELGAKLMKNFLLTLPEMGSTLWRIILLNGGVTLAAQDNPVVEVLQNLEKSGVSILVCGTCLEHFGLLAHKAVGETTNMLDVVTSMQVAEKIIRV